MIGRVMQFPLVAVLALTAALAQTVGLAQTNGIDTALLAKAAAGDAASQVLVADIYANGKGVAQDLKQAAAWYRKAAEQENCTAQVRLAEFYRDGKGVVRDMAQAAEWYRKAAEQGDPLAQGALGVLYSVGQGVPQDYFLAYYWFDLAASVKGPNQDRYAANRQNVGTHLTTEELVLVQERAAKWKAAHPR